MKLKKFHLLIFLLTINFAHGFKVLGVLPYDSSSHVKIGETIMKTLAEFFNNVTVISPQPQNQELHFYTDVSIAYGTSDFEYGEAQAPWILNIFDFDKLPILSGLKYLYESGEDSVNNLMTHPNVIELMESGKTFDVCIIENTHFEALMGLAEVFECILITYTTYPSINLIDRMTSNISPMSYVPNAFLEYTSEMNFCERFWNTANSLIEKVFHEFYHLPNQKRLYEKYFPNAQNSFENVLKNSSIIFINRHINSFGSTPRLPNMIDIGGLHVKQKEELDKRFQKYLDSAKDGVIVFSMGSILQGMDWEESQREAFVQAFGKLKQRVLWKYENKTLPNNPGNIRVSKWLPQRDILAHPNVKLIITHGGLLSLFEAEVESVPVLGIPAFGDQKMNIANAVRRGYALKLDYNDITEDKISAAINELLTNPKYKENAVKAATEFKDRPLTPKLAVLYWTTYAINHGGAPHLRIAGNSLSFIELNSLDVYLSIIVLIALTFFIAFSICKMIIKRIFKKKKKNVSKNQKKKTK